jgi:hypothetical protein
MVFTSLLSSASLARLLLEHGNLKPESGRNWMVKASGESA